MGCARPSFASFDTGVPPVSRPTRPSALPFFRNPGEYLETKAVLCYNTGVPPVSRPTRPSALPFFRNPGECLETRPILCYNSGEEQQV